MVHEMTTTLSGAEVISRAKTFFAERVPQYGTFLERESAVHATFRGQGGEEIAIAVIAMGDTTRIRASTLGVEPDAESHVDAEGLNLSEGRVMLNRRTASAAALIVARGRVKVGVADDDATLSQGEGVLLPAEAVYSLQAEAESLVLLFALRDANDAGEP